MSPESQRIAIAEFCGWRRNGHVSWFHSKYGQKTSATNILPSEALPDYLNDLNAVHEAEKLLNLHQSDRYARALARDNNADQWTSHFRAAHATAAQRCEALLRTIGKWVEE